MLDAGGGGGYAGTNWSAASVIDMWLAIANQDTTPHWQLLSGWRKSYELTLQHMSQVKNYRENLATAWPPEKSPAAAAYLARLDVLIDHLQQTYDAAVANHSAFSSATSAISAARTKLKTVVNEYLANEGKLQTFAQEQAQRPKGGLQRGPEPKPPVPDSRQIQLEAQARSIMYGLSTEITQARTQITKPAPYDPTHGRFGEDSNRPESSYAPPPIPPVVAFDPGTPASHTATSGGSQGGLTQPPLSTTQPSPRVPGLILGGVEPSPIAPTPPPTTNPNPPVTIGPSPTNIPPPSPPLPTPVNTGGPTTPTGGRGRGIAIGTPTDGVFGSPNGTARPMPPGGVIGGMPGRSLGQPGTSGRQPTQVNPVGGVIGPSAGGRPGATGRLAGTTSQPLGGTPGRSLERVEDSPSSARWDPDNPWETAKGVSPVLVPLADQPIDPGPAIGLR